MGCIDALAEDCLLERWVGDNACDFPVVVRKTAMFGCLGFGAFEPELEV